MGGGVCFVSCLGFLFLFCFGLLRWKGKSYPCSSILAKTVTSFGHSFSYVLHPTLTSLIPTAESTVSASVPASEWALLPVLRPLLPELTADSHVQYEVVSSSPSRGTLSPAPPCPYSVCQLCDILLCPGDIAYLPDLGTGSPSSAEGTPPLLAPALSPSP